jgi:aspartate aminotransferase
VILGPRLERCSTKSIRSVDDFVAAKALNFHSFQSTLTSIEEMRLEYLRMRDRAMAELATAPGMRIVLPGGGFFVFPEISEQLLRRNMKTAREFTTALLQKTGVLTVSGEGFGLSNYMRISFSVSEVQLSRGMAKLREFLAA